MKFNGELVVVGMKASKGDYEGVAFDSTKAFCLQDMDTSKGTMIGQATVEYTIGDSTEFEKFKHLPFPFKASAEFELVTTGKAQKTVVRALKPIPEQRVAK